MGYSSGIQEGVLVIGWWSEEPSLKDEACTTGNRGEDLIEEEKELQVNYDSSPTPASLDHSPCLGSE